MKKTFCTADEIAIAVVAASRIEGENPLKVIRGEYGSHARWFAIAALVETFPKADREAIGRGCGIRNKTVAESCGSVVHTKRRRTWWNESAVSRVMAALVGAGLPDARRIEHRETRASINLGDPAPGRSALDMRARA